MNSEELLSLLPRARFDQSGVVIKIGFNRNFKKKNVKFERKL